MWEASRSIQATWRQCQVCGEARCDDNKMFPSCRVRGPGSHGPHDAPSTTSSSSLRAAAAIIIWWYLAWPGTKCIPSNQYLISTMFYVSYPYVPILKLNRMNASFGSWFLPDFCFGTRTNFLEMLQAFQRWASLAFVLLEAFFLYISSR